MTQEQMEKKIIRIASEAGAVGWGNPTFVPLSAKAFLVKHRATLKDYFVVGGKMRQATIVIDPGDPEIIMELGGGGTGLIRGIWGENKPFLYDFRDEIGLYKKAKKVFKKLWKKRKLTAPELIGGTYFNVRKDDDS